MNVAINTKYNKAIIREHEVFLTNGDISFSPLWEMAVLSNVSVKDDREMYIITGDKLEYEFSFDRIYGKNLEKYDEKPKKSILGFYYLPSGSHKLKQTSTYTMFISDVTGIIKNGDSVTLQRGNH